MKDFGDMVDKFYSQAMHVGKREGKDMALLLCVCFYLTTWALHHYYYYHYFFSPKSFAEASKRK